VCGGVDLHINTPKRQRQRLRVPSSEALCKMAQVQHCPNPLTTFPSAGNDTENQMVAHLARQQTCPGQAHEDRLREAANAVYGERWHEKQVRVCVCVCV
jgi:hypothetical protein